MDTILRWLVRSSLGLRYRVRLVGVEPIVAGGTERLLLLPNHPALIDPILLAANLPENLHPLFLADARQVDRPVVRTLAKRYGVRTLPDAKEHGAHAREEVERALEDCAEHLRRGGNLVLYPSGRLSRGQHEPLLGNSAAHRMAATVPGVRVVGVRIRGMWGSSFGWASGKEPQVGPALRRGAAGLLSSFVAFAPKREVTIELHELPELHARAADGGSQSDPGRRAFNEVLERHYAEAAEPATHVPYSIWDRGGVRPLPEPVRSSAVADAQSVPPATRKAVYDHLRAVTGTQTFTDQTHLSNDLGLDSLARGELLVWIEQELGVSVATATSLDTVADVLLAACGEGASTLIRAVRPPAPAWQRRSRDDERLQVGGDAEHLCAAFLDLAERGLDRPILADERSGVKSVGDVLVAVCALRRRLASLEGDHVAVLLPATVAAATSWLALLFAGKTPVMLNWTTGPRNLAHARDALGIRHVLTSRAFVDRARKKGIDLQAVEDRLVYLEDLAASLTKADQAKAWFESRWGRSKLRRITPRDHAVVLFTSGSESLPKAVPLTHRNILQNLRDVTSMVHLRSSDALLAMLPPFHSFGLTACIGLPLFAGLRAVYSPDPTDSGLLARQVNAYRATLLVGTPTFAAGIARSAAPDELSSLRLCVLGAEACPERVRTLLAERCPGAKVLEGYGITECSPVVSLQDEGQPTPGTIGRVLPSLEHHIVDPDSLAPVPRGSRGMLLVHGPSVFDGYLAGPGEKASDPFVELEGRRWYVTGDLVSENERQELVFHGRNRRFVKIAGEMVSLPAIESVLSAWAQKHAGTRDGEAGNAKPQDGPQIAVVAVGGERPELVLVTTLGIERSAANDAIRAAGLSPLHGVRRVLVVEQLPVLGTGKTDYRSVQTMAEAPDSAAA